MSAEDLAGDWIGERDQEGRLYYWNTTTRKVVWEADAPPIIARTAERLATMHARQAKEKAHQEGRRAVEGDIASAIKSWRVGKGIVAQLVTLSQVWPAAAAGGSLGDTLTAEAISSDVAVKKAYFKAVRLVHPDKLDANASAEETVKAGILFEGLREAWEAYVPGDWAQAAKAASSYGGTRAPRRPNAAGASTYMPAAAASAPPPPRSTGRAASASTSGRNSENGGGSGPSSFSSASASGQSRPPGAGGGGGGGGAGGGGGGGVLEGVKRRKSEGNDLFSAGSYALAAGRYKAALDAMGHGTGGGGRGKPPPRGQTELVAMWAQLNLNIALCRVRTGELKAAERDATRVLEAGEEVGLAVAERGKALYRRATVRIAQANLIQDEIAAGGGGGSSGGGGGGGSSSLSGAVKLLRAGCDDLRGAVTPTPTDDPLKDALA
eukprot:COSAG02_NODE_12605_length_1520_cov_1.753695_1_plen_436_part_10